MWNLCSWVDGIRTDGDLHQRFRLRFFKALTDSQEAAFTNDVMNHWLWIRLMVSLLLIQRDTQRPYPVLQLMGSCIILATTLLVTLAISSRKLGALNSSQAGLVISCESPINDKIFGLSLVPACQTL